ncbi:uncharacterized protein LOC130671447 [Microplitis mediator]|uniref:uncharacterized protein LOC130671447 n=1 Tax=Microplitis mediator TaxID=375433 RepID=UPI0025530360|nr:uncharacterized protein LOC130671447 [Microplitis mediator]XP_057331327.1 uncharacterized protein LOC130671447 [Microplitis mediator]
MPLQSRLRNFSITSKSWEIPDINQVLERADRTGHEDPVTLDKEFSYEFRGQSIKWKVELKISSSKLFPGGLSLSFIPISGIDDNTCNFYLVDINKNHLYIGLSDQSTYTNREDPDFVPDRFQRTKEDLLPNNTMTLLIEIFSYWHLDRCSLIPRPKILPAPIDYFELHRQEDHGDVVVIQVQGNNKCNTFSVHRNLLKKSCPVLYEDVVRHQQTFGSNNNSELTLTDIDPEIFRKVVEYIHTDKVCDLDDHSEYLLEAADKYKLIRLKKMCEKSIGLNCLYNLNAPEIYDLAIRCHAPQLKKAALIVRPNIENPTAPTPGTITGRSTSEYEFEITVIPDMQVSCWSTTYSRNQSPNWPQKLTFP